MKIIFSSFLLILILTSCASPFSQYYVDRTRGKDLTNNPNVILPKGKAVLVRGVDKEKDLINMYEKGYRLVGYSSFNSGNVNLNGAITHAESVHASVVIVYTKYTNTVQGVRPVTSFDTEASSTNMSARVTGSEGAYANIYGNSDTTKLRTTTTYVPYKLDRSDYFFSYWIKNMPSTTGLVTRPLRPEEKKETGSKKGVFVIAVVKGSPAYYSDVMRGDIIKNFGDYEITNMQSFRHAKKQYYGEEVTVTLYRNGDLIEKTFFVNEPQRRKIN